MSTRQTCINAKSRIINQLLERWDLWYYSAIVPTPGLEMETGLFIDTNTWDYSFITTWTHTAVTINQCCCPCPRGKSLSLKTNLQVLIRCPWTTKSSNIIKDFAFCKQSVMYNHVKSINSVIATVHEDTVKNVLLTDVRYYLLIYVSK